MSERGAIFTSHATPDDNEFVRWLGTRPTGYYCAPQIGRPSCDSSWSSPCNEEREPPKRRTGLGRVISFCSSAIDNRSRSPRLATATGTDLLRVMISKSLNFTFSVTVRPRDPLSSQWRQTLSISGCSSAAMASNSVRSLENVFSAPTDLRILFERTSRLSTPLDIQ